MEGIALFSTPIFSFDHEVGELDREIAARMIEESERSPGIARSHTGGWHSVPDLSMRAEPCFQELMKRVVSAVQTTFFEIARVHDAEVRLLYRYSVQAWAMVMRDGDYTMIHDHAESHFSVAYYPAVGDGDPAAHPDAGTISFVDPRRGGTMISGIDLFPPVFSISPREGQLLVFPGWLQHFVHPYRGTKPRVSISCNVRLQADLREGEPIPEI